MGGKQIKLAERKGWRESIKFFKTLLEGTNADQLYLSHIKGGITELETNLTMERKIANLQSGRESDDSWDADNKVFYKELLNELKDLKHAVKVIELQKSERLAAKEAAKKTAEKAKRLPKEVAAEVPAYASQIRRLAMSSPCDDHDAPSDIFALAPFLLVLILMFFIFRRQAKGIG